MSLPSSAIAITATPNGLEALVPYCTATHTPLLLPAKLQSQADSYQEIGLSVQLYADSLREILPSYWGQCDALIFALATGAVVRLIAPLLRDKATDPAVVVIDDGGHFAISLCGGHRGGGDRLAQSVSHHLNATPVLTGAANYQQLPGIDVLGQPFGWNQGSGDWTGVASVSARGEPVQIIQEAGNNLWQAYLPHHHTWQFGWTDLPGSPADQLPEPKARVWISPIQRRFSPTSGIPKVQWHPRVLWIGLGCERGTPQALMNQAVMAVCRSRHLAMEAIAGVATIDLKADEEGLLQLCREHHWPLRCFHADQLQAVTVPHPSAVVATAVGTPSVAEAAAILAATQPLLPFSATDLTCSSLVRADALPLSGQTTATDNLSDPQKERGAPNRSCLCVTKKVIRHPGYPGAVTIAIAQAEQEYTARAGHLALVGIGPGHLDQMTPAAKAAVSQADAVIGYQRYIDFIRPLVRPGQIVEAWPITQEHQRAERAIALANWGLSVAVVSSGDCGIYGMAGLVLELLQAQDWNGSQPAVTHFPGISALQAAAARVGAPLMHDFCAISLSDLLTPWPVIETRLQAAATADFVVALYNPKSQQRTEPMAMAQRLFAQHRPPQTPVAIVRSAYRVDEHITLTTVADMVCQPIDMLTTVIIGNRSTRFYANRLITPRGYSV